jgi:hypothetical protein
MNINHEPIAMPCSKAVMFLIVSLRIELIQLNRPIESEAGRSPYGSRMQCRVREAIDLVVYNLNYVPLMRLAVIDPVVTVLELALSLSWHLFSLSME